jgi:HAD superfamily phosphoserine phosphatase-like hydrolase
MIKIAAFDNDCVISKYDMIEFISKHIGKSEEGQHWEKEYHKGLSTAKSDEEKEIMAERGLKGKFSVIKGLDLNKLKEICTKIELTAGAKECIDKIHEKGIKIVVVSATLFPIAKFFAEANGLKIDDFITSECDGNDKIEETSFVLTPLKKGERLKEYLNKNGVKTEECIVIGDSTSEASMFRMVGKERSIGFNCRDSLKPFVGYVASDFGDENRNLMSVFEIINKLESQTPSAL